MERLRKYGSPPYTVILLHGGPGAAGDMSLMAHQLSLKFGVLEPLQNATSVQGQIEELKKIIEKYKTPSVVIVGFSWGSWLGILFTAKYQKLVNKLILIGCGPLDKKYIPYIQKTRFSRLNKIERAEIDSIVKIFSDPGLDINQKNKAFARFGEIFSSTDAFDPITSPPVKLIYDFNIFHKVSKECSELRNNQKLLQQVKKITCPVTAIHGDYDPHPAEGVNKPLSSILIDFNFILLKNCGHKPWAEKYARKEFYTVMQNELTPLT